MDISKSVQDKIFDYIDAIAQKLGVAAEFVMKALIKQQIISGATFLLLWLLFAILDTVLIVLLVKWAKRYSDARKELAVKRIDGRYGHYAVEEEATERTGVWTAIYGAIVGLLTLIIVMSLVMQGPDAIGKLLNPSYYALKDIIDAVK